MIWGCTFAGGVGEPVFSHGALKIIEVILQSKKEIA